jgi:citrate synthase
MSESPPVFHSNIWEEEAEPNNLFEAKSCYCNGYDVYGDLLGKASWIEYLYLMFKGERPSSSQAKLLEHLAVAFANRGPRDSSVRAAMNGGVGGSVAAGSLMAALAVGAGQYGGAHEVYIAVNLWEQCGKNIDTWKEGIKAVLANKEVDIWLPMEHAPGFEPNGLTCPTPVLKTLDLLSQYCDEGALSWLQSNREL